VTGDAGVLCLVETDDDGVIDASLRALTFARTLAESSDAALAAAIVGPFEASLIDVLGAFGVGDVHAIMAEELRAYSPTGWAQALLGVVESTGFETLVAAGTDRGNEVMAHVGALTGLAMVANCLGATRVGSSVSLSRQRWGGSLIEDAVLQSATALLTVAFDGVRAERAATSCSTTVHEHHPAFEAPDLDVVVAQWTGRSGGVSLAEARVVVGAGRGVGSAEGFGTIDELAQLLGAAVGVSRAVTSLGWRPHNQQVGQTGTRISPELYLVSGISGATQHLAGCQSAKHVVAINTDADAPIIARADWAVIGDLNEVIPALVSAIRERNSKGA
jgi:electron transfer flavoprotein alpha subunit